VRRRKRRRRRRMGKKVNHVETVKKESTRIVE
jgi:hypothetical protein